MLILQVHIHVKPDQIEAFKTATKQNALRSTMDEPGCVRFDVLQQADDPSRFTLLEVYRSSDAAARHKETAHYNHWREVAEPLLAEPRSRLIYTNIYPPDTDY
jgi:autoinducer 2-degrading protein